MAESVIALMPVQAVELVVSKPLPRAIYDWHGNLLLASGCVVESLSQLNGLVEHGFTQDPSLGSHAK